jgi:exodeoxyribonuclease VII large subunit
MAFPSPPAGVKILTIGELNQAIKGLLEEGFPHVWVTGEISNLSRPSSGHLYFTLKDANAQLKAVIWRSTNQRLRFEPRDGMEVFACGRITVYAPRGDCQLAIEQLQPKGVGELELALRQLREKLSKLGYFARERKKPLPAYPRRVAVVTSPSGAAVRDMLEILGRRWPAADVVICPVRVQGDGAAEGIAGAIDLLNRLRAAKTFHTDVMIIGRGGGSSEDLGAFNDERVARAIFGSRIPVVSAVGHEVDVTIADLVADRRALTPSEAAELVVPHRLEQRDIVGAYGKRMRHLISHRLDVMRRRLDELANRRVFRLPLERIRDLERRLDDWSCRLDRCAQQRLGRERERVEVAAARLEALSPLNVLARGYSLTRTGTGREVVRSPDQVRPGDLLETRIQHGRIVSRVEETRPAEPGIL